MFGRCLAAFTACLVIGVIAGNASGDESLQLVLRVQQRGVCLDDCIEFELSLVGGTVDELVQVPISGGYIASGASASRDISDRAHRASLGSQTYRFVPTEVGSTKIGPFTLEFGSQSVQSNAIDIMIAPAPDDPGAIRLIPATNRIPVGQVFILTVVAFSGSVMDEGPKPDKLEFMDSDVLEVRMVGKQTEVFGHLCVDGFKTKYVYEYRIRPLAAGILTFGKGSFRAAPDGVVFQSATVEVHE